MATIVKHNETGKHLVLVGTGYGAFSSKTMNGFYVSSNTGEMTMLACAFQMEEFYGVTQKMFQ